MSDRERVHCEDLVRSGPIRNFSNLYSRPDPSQPQMNQGKPVATEKSGNSAVNGAPPSSGVELAYRVLEEYFVAGRRSAEQISSRTFRTRNSFSSNDSLEELLERMLRFQSEMLPLWVAVLGRLLRPDVARTFSSPAAASSAPDRSSSHNGTTTASVEVASARSALVSLELGETRDFKALITQGLRALDPAKPPLSEVSFVSTPGNCHGTVRIRIPDSQPPGIYSNVVIDRETGETRGTLSVRIAE